MDPFIPEPWRIESEAPAESGHAESTAEAAAPKAEPRVWLEIVAILGFTMVPSIWASITILLAPNHDWRWQDDWPTLILTALQAFAVVYFIRIARIPFARIGIVRPRWSDLGVALAILILHFGTSGILHRVIPYLFGKEERPPLPDDFDSTSFTLYLTSRIVGASFEELVARGYLITRAWDASGSPLFAVALSSLLFAAGHLYQGPRALIYLGVMGLLYGFAFVLFRRLGPLVLAHLAWNLLIAGKHY